MSTSRAVRRDIRVAVVAVLAGLAATLAPPAPTANPVVDAVLVGVGVALITLVGALAPGGSSPSAPARRWRSPSIRLLMVLALAALGAALWVGATRRGTAPTSSPWRSA